MIFIMFGGNYYGNLKVILKKFQICYSIITTCLPGKLCSCKMKRCQMCLSVQMVNCMFGRCVSSVRHLWMKQWESPRLPFYCWKLSTMTMMSHLYTSVFLSICAPAAAVISSPLMINKVHCIRKALVCRKWLTVRHFIWVFLSLSTTTLLYSGI